MKSEMEVIMNTQQIAKKLVQKITDGYVGPDNIWGLALHYLADSEETYNAIISNPDYHDGKLLFVLLEKEWALVANEDGEIAVSEEITSDIPEGMSFVTEEEMLAVSMHGTTLH